MKVSPHNEHRWIRDDKCTQIVSEEDRNAQMRATIVGGAKGFGGGLAFALPVSYLLNRRWTYYRQLPPSLKAFGVILVAVPAFVINAEHAGLKYEKEHWCVATLVRRSCWSPTSCDPRCRTDVGAHELDIRKEREQASWDKMGPLEKLKVIAGKHEYGFIGGAWAATMVGAFGWIMRDKCVSCIAVSASAVLLTCMHRHLDTRRCPRK